MRRRRGWLLLGGGVLALLIAVGAGIYVWALLSTDESTVARALIWRESDVGDQHRFPARQIPTGDRASRLPSGNEADLALGSQGAEVDDFLRETETLAFAVVRDDELVLERYFSGAKIQALGAMRLWLNHAIRAGH